MGSYHSDWKNNSEHYRKFIRSSDITSVSGRTGQSFRKYVLGCGRWLVLQKGDYSLLQFVAERNGDKVTVKLTKKTGKYNTENKDMAVIKIITDQGIRQASGNLVEGIEIRL